MSKVKGRHRHNKAALVVALAAAWTLAAVAAGFTAFCFYLLRSSFVPDLLAPMTFMRSPIFVAAGAIAAVLSLIAAVALTAVRVRIVRAEREEESVLSAHEQAVADVAAACAIFDEDIDIV